MTKLDIKLFAWVLRGSQRREIIKWINGTRIPAQIYEEAIKHNTKITRNSVSDVLRVFREKGLVKCLNPSESKGRLYKLTEKGDSIRKEISND